MDQKLRIGVIYYSFEGNTRLVSQGIAAQTGAELLELKPQKELATHGFMKYFWGGKQAVMKERPALLPLERRPEEYDLIFLGTPVWAFTYAPPLNTFLAEYPLRNKQIAIFCCDDGSKGKTFANLRAALTGNTILGEMELVAPLRKDQATVRQQVQKWAEAMCRQASQGSVL
jgi:flavodoxin